MLAAWGVIGQARLLGHFNDLQGARQAAEIADVGLGHVNGAHLHGKFPQGKVAILFAARHIKGQRVGDLLGPVIFPIGAWLLKMHNAVLLQELADFDGLLRRVAAVGVDQQCSLVAQRLAHHGNNGIGAPRPFVLVMAAFLADAEFEGGVAVFIAQARQAFGFRFGGDFAALHA